VRERREGDSRVGGGVSEREEGWKEVPASGRRTINRGSTVDPKYLPVTLVHVRPTCKINGLLIEVVLWIQHDMDPYMIIEVVLWIHTEVVLWILPATVLASVSRASSP
jgi:hypothetical protein